MGIIHFEQLAEAHFSLLLKWLNHEHVKPWWDKYVIWTHVLIKKKYESYVKGYTHYQRKRKKIMPFIIYIDKDPVGYIQLYNAHDFHTIQSLINLPKSLGSFDMYIGEPTYLRKGIGTQALTQFLTQYSSHYNFDYTLACPSVDNVAAIKTYLKAGFCPIKEEPSLQEVWMLRDNFILNQ